MKKIKKYNQFITESFNNDKTMNILDLIYVLEQKDPNAYIIQRNEQKSNDKGASLFIIDTFIKIGSDNTIMGSLQYYTKYDGSNYDFYSYDIIDSEDKLFGTTARFEMGDEEVELDGHKTIGDHIKELKKISNPEKSLFFMRSSPLGYNSDNQTYNNVFESIMGLGNYNIESYPLVKDGKIVSGNMTEAFSFMGKGSDGRFMLKEK